MSVLVKFLMGIRTSPTNVSELLSTILTTHNRPIEIFKFQTNCIYLFKTHILKLDRVFHTLIIIFILVNYTVSENMIEYFFKIA